MVRSRNGRGKHGRPPRHRNAGPARPEIRRSFYPERLHRLFAVNVDWLGKTVWFAVKPFLKEATRNKIVLIGDNNDEIFKALDGEMDIDAIPIEFGGKFFVA